MEKFKKPTISKMWYEKDILEMFNFLNRNNENIEKMKSEITNYWENKQDYCNDKGAMLSMIKRGYCDFYEFETAQRDTFIKVFINAFC